MLGKIISIDERTIELELAINLSEVKNIIDLYVLIADGTKNFIGEISNIKKSVAYINILGEVTNNRFVYGFSNKPSFASKINIIAPSFVNKIIGITDVNKELYIGHSEVYPDVKVGAKLNDLFSQHFAFIGSTGSGKSCGFAKMIQNLFNGERYPKNATIFVIDAYGEYHNAFSRFDNNINFKHITTNLKSETEKLSIPVWLLDVDDLALLLNVGKRSQLSLLDKTLKFVNVFKKHDEISLKYQNSIIAKALQEILVSGRSSSQIRDQFFAVLTKYNTDTLNLETEIVQPGYTRTIKQCLNIDAQGKMNSVQYVVDLLEEYKKLDLGNINAIPNFVYSLDDIYYALEFALVSEGVLKSDKMYDEFNQLKVRLQQIINSDYKMFFDVDEYVSKKDFVRRLFNSDRKYQIINFNLNYIDERFAKKLTKIYSKLFFDFSTFIDDRGSFPIHIILEEAHRYVQHDTDIDILGYNIFDRITKEGRKYGVILGLITQRPSELSITALSQCSNFIVLRMFYPDDLNIIKSITSNLGDSIFEKIKSFLPGNALVFGTSFKLPLMVKLDLPNPMPESTSVNISDKWYK